MQDEFFKLWEQVLYEEEWSERTRSGAPPLYQTSNFVFRTVADMQEALRHEDEIPFYTRGANPTVSLVAEKLATLEGMEAGLLFGSGSSAIAAAVLSQVQTGDKVLSIADPYSWSKKLITQFCAQFGVDHEFCTQESIGEAISDRTKVIYLESPNSWTFETYNLLSITQLAKSRGITTILDNSYSTPLLQQAAAVGVDLVAHSATKYLSGHSDLVAGALCGSKALIKDVFNGPYMTLGAALSPFDAWLLLRSLRTLPIRLKAIKETTQAVIEFLEQHPKVSTVYFPGTQNADLQPVPQTGLLSIDLATADIKRVEKFCDSLKYFKLGPSWGLNPPFLLS